MRGTTKAVPWYKRLLEPALVLRELKDDSLRPAGRRCYGHVAGALEDGEAGVFGEARVGVGESTAQERRAAIGGHLALVDAGGAEAGLGHKTIVD